VKTIFDAMRPWRTSAVFLTLAALPLLGGCVPQGESGEPSRYSVEWVVSQAADAVDTYTVEVTVLDIASGDVIAHPRMYARWGEPAEITQSSSGTGEELMARVFVDATGTSAKYELEMTRAGRKVLSHSANVNLQGTMPAGFGG